MLTQRNQAPGMVKPKFEMKEKDIKDVTIAEYIEYEAETKRQSWRNAQNYFPTNHKELLPCFEPVQLHELLKEDTDYVLEDESEPSDQKLMNHTISDKPFTPKTRPEDEELSFDEDLDDWLKLKLERRMYGHDTEGEEDALIAILKSLVDECKVVYTNKEKDISGALPCQLPPKELNPESFTLPCTIGSLNLHAMEDLGASVNIMPRLIFKHLNLANLKKTDMLVEMADMTRRAPLGIVVNVLVKINKFLFPFDFMIMGTIGEPNETMILGRPFMATIGSLKTSQDKMEQSSSVYTCWKSRYKKRIKSQAKKSARNLLWGRCTVTVEMAGELVINCLTGGLTGGGLGNWQIWPL
nr:hypothetical protein [Tanacetum cinerariifolium]